MSLERLQKNHLDSLDVSPGVGKTEWTGSSLRDLEDKRVRPGAALESEKYPHPLLPSEGHEIHIFMKQV